MTYTHTTLLQAKTQLASRLQDTSMSRWSSTELGICIIESLRTWQMLTSYYRDRDVFDTVSGTIFYDLPTQLSSLLGYTVHTSDLITALEYNLLEPVALTSWSGSSMFTLSDLITALTNRRNQFLTDTGSVVSRLTSAISPVPIYREPVIESVISVLRVAWINTSGSYRNLWRTIDFRLTAYLPNWTQTPGDPKMFSTLATPPLTIQIVPPPLDTGSLEIIAVLSPSPLDSISSDVLLNIPDDMTWIIRFGALSDLLLREGDAHDSVRGQYARFRYEHGIRAAAFHKTIISAELNGVTRLVSSVYDFDAYRPGWQNLSGKPSFPLMMGSNLLGLYKVPDDIYSVTCDVVRNAPIPADDSDFIQIGREDLQVILGYAQHLATFDLGGQEFLDTMPLLQSFLSQAKSYNSRLSELDEFVKTNIQQIPTAYPQATPLSVVSEVESAAAAGGS